MRGPRQQTESLEQKPLCTVLPLAECAAKTVAKENGSIELGIGVLEHGFLAGLVARKLVERQPRWLVEALYPPGSELLVALHDVGKVSPGFQEKIYRAIRNADYPNGRTLGLCRMNLDEGVGYHQTVSMSVLAGRGKYCGEIIGRHHGDTPQQSANADAEIYGGPAWQQMREELIEQVKRRLNVEWPQIQNENQADALSGLTCVSDWIASGSAFDHVDIENPRLNQQIESALNLAGFIAPQLVMGLSFEQVFGFSPRSSQTTFCEVVSDSGAYVLEAPMGMGKTEAALYAAYKVMEQHKATGIYFALPTQLTSDKVFDRMNRFLEKILEPDCVHRTSLLLHGSAWLRQTEVGGEGQPGRSWFDSRKRGLLAPFAVGTMDQALMAAMNVKHGFVRAFGLAGKVVILDEVHSYDAYTGTLLDRLVKVLRELRCTVIILSATLTAGRRAALLASEGAAASSAYPLVSVRPSHGIWKEYPVEKGSDMPVELAMKDDEKAAVEEALERASRGEQVLWIENTVDDAQRRYRKIAARAVDFAECGLVHSRFLKRDRWQSEDHWVGIYGKAGGAQRILRGRILVGTQVLEQSLDIDADFLVTRMCPMDLLFQRVGRLWRHQENNVRRPTAARPQVWVLAPSLDSALENENVFGKTAKVYAPYVLCRTLEVLQDVRSGVLAVPGDIRPLLEAVYRERAEEGAWARYKQELEREREKLQNLARGGLSRDSVTLPESKASTRYSEMESAEVLLVRVVEKQGDGVRVSALDGSVIYLPAAPIARKTKEWREAAATLKQNTVNVPEYLAPKGLRADQLGWLKNYFWLGDKEESPFRVARVQPSGELLGMDGQSANEKYNLSYDAELGYTASK